MQLFSVLMAFSTVTGIAAIAPFFAVLGDAQLIDHNAALRWLYIHGGFTSRRSFVVGLGAGFVAVMLLANLVNLLGTLAMNRAATRRRAAGHPVRGISAATVFVSYRHQQHDAVSTT